MWIFAHNFLLSKTFDRTNSITPAHNTTKIFAASFKTKQKRILKTTKWTIISLLFYRACFIYCIYLFFCGGIRVEGWGWKAASRPDELSGHRTREGQAVSAGDFYPQEQTLPAGEGNGWGQPVSNFFICTRLRSTAQVLIWVPTVSMHRYV